MNKNDEFELTIEDLSVEGEGIGHFDGMTFFVKDAITGDVILARCTKLKKRYGFARVQKVITPSLHRTEPICHVAGKCGGCRIMHMDYEEQLRVKQRMVREKLIRLGGFSEEETDRILKPIVGMEEPYHFRNKAQYPVARSKEGQVMMGFYAPHSHRVVESETCYLGDGVNEKIRSVIKAHPEISVYDEEIHRVLLRHVLIRRGYHTGEVMVCLVVNATDENASVTSLTETLLPELIKVEGMHSVVVNFNPSEGNVILGQKTKTLWGEEVIRDRIGEITFMISAPSFYQVNSVMTEKLYAKALEYAALTGQETVWDLYCGIGTISLFLAQKAKHVYGVEVVPEAVEDAKKNARLNGIENAAFLLGKAEEVLPAFYAAGGSTATPDATLSAENAAESLHPDVIVVDPPRKGCDEACLQTMVAMSPARIVYVSCDPATLARDLKYLCANGYELKEATPSDPFCHSLPVETVVLLSRKAD